jgi:hypothetical protein
MWGSGAWDCTDQHASMKSSAERLDHTQKIITVSILAVVVKSYRELFDIKPFTIIYCYM